MFYKALSFSTQIDLLSTVDNTAPLPHDHCSDSTRKDIDDIDSHRQHPLQKCLDLVNVITLDRSRRVCLPLISNEQAERDEGVLIIIPGSLATRSLAPQIDQREQVEFV